MIPAVGYLRVSGTGQRHKKNDNGAEKGHGWLRQHDTIEDYARKNGYQTLCYYLEAWTGKDENRPVFMAMIEDLLSNGCTTILIESMDRWGRKTLASEQLLALTIQHSLTIISAISGDNITEDWQNDEDPLRRFFVQLRMNMAELDRRLLVRKLYLARLAAKRADAKRRGVKHGRCEGNKPYGYYPGEEIIVERVKALAGEGVNCTQIARRLTDEDVVNRHGRVAWSYKVVKSILSAQG